MTDEYVVAARNKTDSARRHLAALDKLRSGEESERPQVQDAFEDIVSRGFSVGDQSAGAIALRLGLEIRNVSPNKLPRTVPTRPRDRDRGLRQSQSEE